MNVNYGLFPPIEAPARAPGAPRARGDRVRAKRRALAERALADVDDWITDQTPAGVPARYSAA